MPMAAASRAVPGTHHVGFGHSPAPHHLRPCKSQGQSIRTHSFADDGLGELYLDKSELVTIFTSEGMVQFHSKFGTPMLRKPKVQPMPTWEEQKICIGSVFKVAATNGHNPSRRINIQGFCHSVDLLFESVEDVVNLRGGEILDEERRVKSGLHEEVKLIVAMPLLWGVPPTLDCLRSAIEMGGGIVDRVYHQWDIY